MQNQILVTVTTAEGQPSFYASADLDMDQLRRLVRSQYQMQCDGQNLAIPHSFCARRLDGNDRHERTRVQPLLINRGHLRAI